MGQVHRGARQRQKRSVGPQGLRGVQRHPSPPAGEATRPARGAAPPAERCRGAGHALAVPRPLPMSWSGCEDSPDILGTVSQPSLDLELEDDTADPTYTVRELADAINAVLQRGSPTGSGSGARSRGSGAGQRPRLLPAHRGQRRGQGDVRSCCSAAPSGGWPRCCGAPVAAGGRHAVRIFGRLEFYAPTGASRS